MQTQPALYSKLIAEFVGTMTLCAVGVGSVVVAAGIGLPSTGGLLAIAFAHGLAIAVMVTAVGHVSGGHFNPAVTTAMMALRQIKPVAGLAYILVQLAGGVAGSFVVMQAFNDSKIFDRFDPVATVQLTSGMGPFTGIMLEAFTTFLLVWVIFAVAVDRDGAFFKVAGMPIGFTIVMDILMIGPLTGGTMNPARWFGPNVLNGAWDNAIVWIAGPVIGALIAGFLYMYGIKPRTADA